MTNFLTPLTIALLSPFIEIVLTTTLNLLTDAAAKLEREGEIYLFHNKLLGK